MPAFNWVASRQQQQRAGVRAGAGATSSTAPAPARSKRRSLDLVSLSSSALAAGAAQHVGEVAPPRSRFGSPARRGLEALAGGDSVWAPALGPELTPLTSMRTSRAEQGGAVHDSSSWLAALDAPSPPRASLGVPSQLQLPSPSPSATDGLLPLPADDFGFRHVLSGGPPPDRPPLRLHLSPPPLGASLTALDAALDAPRRLSDGLAGVPGPRSPGSPPPLRLAEAAATGGMGGVALARRASPPASPVAALPSCARSPSSPAFGLRQPLLTRRPVPPGAGAPTLISEYGSFLEPPGEPPEDEAATAEEAARATNRAPLRELARRADHASTQTATAPARGVDKGVQAGLPASVARRLLGGARRRRCAAVRKRALEYRGGAV